MIVRAVGGLCNRLQAILSLRAVHGPISVLWAEDAPVSKAHFLDVLEPIAGVTFVSSGSPIAEAWAVHPGAPAGWESAHAELRPRAHVQSRIVRHVDGLSPFVAIHVRRTDHVPNSTSRGEPVEGDRDFADWCALHGSLPVWIATDNGETQRAMSAALSSRRCCVAGELPGDELQALGDNRRNGSLEHAVVDLFVCAQAAHFKGSRHSSFSDTIERLRRVRS